MADLQHPHSHRRIVDCLVYPFLFFEDEVGSYHTTLAEDIENLMILIAVRNDNINHAVKDKVYVFASIAHVEQHLL